MARDDVHGPFDALMGRIDRACAEFGLTNYRYKWMRNRRGELVVAVLTQDWRLAGVRDGEHRPKGRRK